MSPLALGLILLSSLLHATWNLLLKRAHDKLAFTTLSLLVACVLYFPMFLYEIRTEAIPPLGWLCVLGTGIAYCGYFIGLAIAYETGDLSLVYPLTRGLGPALAFIGGVLVLSELPSSGGMAGVGLILLGIVTLHYKRSVGRFRPGKIAASTLAALFVGLMVGIYSLIDKYSVGRLHLSPPLYIYLTYTLSALMIFIWFAGTRGKQPLMAEWRSNALPCVVVGILNLFTYLLVLYAMSLPHTPVSYVVPLRSSSVLIGVLFGVKVLGEDRPLAKFGGAALVVAGVIMIAWKG